jgi:hypothetical protein
MRTKRLLGALAAGTIAAIAPLSATIASAQDASGVGTAAVSSTLLQVDVGANGNVLHVRLLGDDGTSTIDPAKGTPSATTSLSPLTITSGVVPALNIAVPPVSTSSSGAEDKQSVEPALPDVPAFAGSLGATLSSIVDTAGARSGLDAALSDLSVAGGLLAVPSAAAVLGSNAATTASTGTQSITIPSIEVLNLGAVLEALGLPLADLPIDTLLDLLGGLGIVLPEIDDPADAVAALDAAIDSIEGVTGPLTDTICNEVDGLLGTVGGLTGTVDLGEAAEDVVDDVVDGATGGLPDVPGVPDLLSTKALPVSCSSVTGTVEDLLDDLQGVLGDLLGGILGTLADTSLLSVDNISVGVLADAKSTVESSVAQVTGTIGAVRVGTLEVPGVSGLDLTAATDVISGAADTVTAAVGDVLALVNAQLADLVDVDVLEITEQVVQDGDYTGALAAVTALRATITPPGLLTGALDVAGSAGDVLGDLGTQVPALAPLMAELEVALGGLELLTDVTTITVGQVSSSSAFRPAVAPVPGAPTPSGELPRTGTDAALPAMAAVLVAGVALGIRRFIAAVTA